MAFNRNSYLTDEDRKAQDDYLDNNPKASESWVRLQTKEYLNAYGALKKGSADYYKLKEMSLKREENMRKEYDDSKKPTIPLRGEEIEDKIENKSVETPATASIVNSLEKLNSDDIDINIAKRNSDLPEVVEKRDESNIESLDKKLEEEVQNLSEPQKNFNTEIKSTDNIVTPVKQENNNIVKEPDAAISNLDKKKDFTNIDNLNLKINDKSGRLTVDSKKEIQEMSKEDEELVRKEYGQIFNFDLPPKDEEEKERIQNIKNNLLIEIKKKEVKPDNAAEAVKKENKINDLPQPGIDKNLAKTVTDNKEAKQDNFSKEDEELVRKEYGQIFNFDLPPKDEEEKERIQNIKKNLLVEIKQKEKATEEKINTKDSNIKELPQSDSSNKEPQDKEYDISSLEDITKNIQSLVSLFNGSQDNEKKQDKQESSTQNNSEKNMQILTSSLDRLNHTIHNLIGSLNNNSFNNTGNTKDKLQGIQLNGGKTPRETMAVNTGAIESYRGSLRKMNQAQSTNYMPSIPGFSI